MKWFHLKRQSKIKRKNTFTLIHKQKRIEWMKLSSCYWHSSRATSFFSCFFSGRVKECSLKTRIPRGDGIRPMDWTFIRRTIHNYSKGKLWCVTTTTTQPQPIVSNDDVENDVPLNASSQQSITRNDDTDEDASNIPPSSLIVSKK